MENRFLSYVAVLGGFILSSSCATSSRNPQSVGDIPPGAISTEVDGDYNCDGSKDIAAIFPPGTLPSKGGDGYQLRVYLVYKSGSTLVGFADDTSFPAGAPKAPSLKLEKGQDCDSVVVHYQAKTKDSYKKKTKMVTNVSGSLKLK